MSTFIGQLIGFAVIVFIIVKWVVPPVKGLMQKQQEAIRVALAESEEAAKKLAEADAMHAKAVEEAKAESAKVTEEAKADSERIEAQLQEQAVTEAERIKAQGEQQVHLLRQQTIRGLRHELGADSVQKAEELVRQYVSDPAQQSATVDRFLGELESMAPSTAVLEAGASLNLRAASREALAVAAANAQAHQINNVEFRHGDWWAPLDGERFDLIASNPPYIADADPHLEQGDLRFEPHGARLEAVDSNQDWLISQ